MGLMISTSVTTMASQKTFAPFFKDTAIPSFKQSFHQN
jgi:hypothetical protein